MTATSVSCVVQVAPGVGPLEDITDGQWVTLTASAVVDVSCQHGRQTEFDTFSAGTCSVTFEDRDRDFDPLNASGPHYGGLNPGMPVRVRAFTGSTYYPRWRGFVERIETQNARTSTFVTLTCSDAFKLFNQRRLPQSVYEQVVLDDGPVLYARLGEQGPTAADISGNRYDGDYRLTSTVQQASESIVPYSDTASVEMTGTSDTAVVFPSEARETSSSGAFELWLETDVNHASLGAGEYFIFHQGDASSSDNRRALSYNPAGVTSGGPELWLYVFDIAYKRIIRSVPRLDDGRPHHIVMRWNNSTGDLLLIDGIVYNESAGSNNQDIGYYGNSIYIGAAPGSGAKSFQGRIAHFAVYDNELTVEAFQAHHTAAITPWTGDSTGDRITRILDLIDWPAGLRAIDNGETRLGPADLNGVSVLSYLQLVAQTEGGRFFIDATGNVTFHDAARFLRETVENTSQYTFSDDEAGDAVYSGGGFSRDDTLLYTSASIQRKYGTPQTASDQTAIDTYGEQTYELSGLLHLSDSLARAQAERIVGRYKDPQSRVAALTVQPDLDSAAWPDLLDLEVGHRVTVEQTPGGTGSQVQLEQHIESVSDQISGDTWKVSFVTSPADPNVDSYFTWGGDGATQGWDTGVWR